MATTRGNLEQDFQNLYVNERDLRAHSAYSPSSPDSYSSPQSRTIATHHIQNVSPVSSKPPTPQRCEIEIPGRFRIQIQAMGKKIHVKHSGLPNVRHVMSPGGGDSPLQDDMFPIQSITYHRAGSPTNPRAVYVSPGYMQPQQLVNRRAPLPINMAAHMPPGSPDRFPNEYDYPTPPSSAADSYYDDEDYIPAAMPKRVGYGSMAANYNPQADKIITSSYTHPVRPRERSRSPDMSQRGTIIPVTHLDRHGRVSPQPQSFTEKYGSEKYPIGVRSQLLYTAPAGVATGFVQSRPTNADNVSPPPPPPPANFSPTRSYDTSPTSPTSYSESPSPTRSKPQEIYAYPSKVRAPPQGHNEPSKQVKTSPTNEGKKQGPASPKEKEAEIDALTNLLVQNMEAAQDPDFYGMCGKCGRAIMGENQGCSALDQLYHLQCFVCVECEACLGGQPFFAMEGKPHCEPCYLNTLEKCSVCSVPITDRILRATGKPYHPKCFMCVVCGKSLDGIPFTVDATNQIHCIEDFHRKFAPRCCVCNLPIMPEVGKEETVRIVAMDRSFHTACYTCEDCGTTLSSEAEGRGCYPLDDHILCKNCNARRIQAMTTKMTTEL